uniref:Ankyrin repeat protein n=1 Tax=Trypanosoma vivax (strain Y486) TaxID=1055687 RepID=G0TZH5_TRYVY|nr:conserved hypothetical protein, fragment [Trypanosoma vivax Y486]
MSHKSRRHIIEDPNNTWNSQLMQACLRYNIEEAETLLNNGADPRAAREPVSFYSHPLPPLVALLLQGRYSVDCVAMMNWLVEKGARVSDPIPLPDKNVPSSIVEHGTILHYIVQLGQPILLFEVLAFMGEQRPCPVSIVKRLFRTDLAFGALVGSGRGHLDTLLARGLDVDTKNALGETALVSLICYGQGCNAEHAIRDSPRPSDAARLAALPLPMLRNYILTPQIPQQSGTSSRYQKVGAAASQANNTVDMDYPCLSRDANAWWYFLPAQCNTWDLIQVLCERGANVHGEAPKTEMAQAQLLANRKPSGTTSQYGASGTVFIPRMIQHDKKSYSYSSANAASLTGDLQATITTDAPTVPSTGAETKSYDHARSSFDSNHFTCRTPLMHAITAYHPELIRRLILEYKADPMVHDAHGACALHYAAVARNPSVMGLFLSSASIYQERRIDINVQDFRGRTPLHYAVTQGNLAVVQALLATASPGSPHAPVAGSSANHVVHVQPGKTDFEGRTSLHLAVLSSQLAVIGALLHHVENTLASAHSDTTNVPAGTSSGSGKRRQGLGTTASRRKHRHSTAAVECVAGDIHAMPIDVEARDTLLGFTALEMAVRVTHNVEAARLLLRLGVVNVRHSSGLSSGGTLLHYVVTEGLTEMLTVLLEFYADPNDMDCLEQTPLHLATQSTLPCAGAMVRILLQFGAVSEVQSGCTLETPLVVAARRGDVEMIDLLLHQSRRLSASNVRPFKRGLPRNASAWKSDGACTTQGSVGATSSSRSRHITHLQNGTPPLSRRGRPASQATPRQFTQRSPQRTRIQKHQNTEADTCSSTLSDTNEDLWTAIPGSGRDTMELSAGSHFQETQNGKSSSPTCGDPELNAACGVGSAGSCHLTINPYHFLATDTEARTALHHLCAHNDPTVQEQLLPHIRDILGCTLAQTLVLQIDSAGRLPLHDACAAGNGGAVVELLKHDTCMSAFFLDARGCTPLHHAVMADSEACIKALVQAAETWLPTVLHGASAAMDNSRVVPLSQRILEHAGRSQRKGFGLCKESHPLQEQGRRDTAIMTMWDYLNVYDSMGRTPVLLAAELGKLEAAATLARLLAQYRSEGMKWGREKPLRAESTLHGALNQCSSVQSLLAANGTLVEKSRT